MFGKKTTGDLKRVLEGGNPQIADVIACADFPGEYRESEIQLIEFLFKKETLEALVEKLTTSEKRDFHQLVDKQLLKTTTTTMHRHLAWSDNFCKLVFSSLDPAANEKEATLKEYGAGTLARLVSRALDAFPGFFRPMFRANGGELYKKVILNIGKGFIWQSIDEIRSDQNEGLNELMYHICRKVMSDIGDHNCKVEKPLSMYGVPDLEFKNDETLNPTALSAAFKTIDKFVALDLESARDTVKSFFVWISKLDKDQLKRYPDLMGIAARTRKGKHMDKFGYGDAAKALYERAMEFLAECENGVLLDLAFGYVAECVECQDELVVVKNEDVFKFLNWWRKEGEEKRFDQAKVPHVVKMAVSKAVDEAAVRDFVLGLYNSGDMYLRPVAVEITTRRKLEISELPVDEWNKLTETLEATNPDEMQKTYPEDGFRNPFRE